jgi:hypothetical protein
MCCELNHVCDCKKTIEDIENENIEEYFNIRLGINNGTQLKINWKEYEVDNGTKDNKPNGTGS